jgi:hypothetical protein
VTAFLIDDPSIEEIFIERVGRKPTEDQHLGGASAARLAAVVGPAAGAGPRPGGPA